MRDLGVTHLETLGYHDSGMADWEYKDHGHVFCNVPLDESVARVLELMQQYRPDVMITYSDFTGGYGHPDHRRAHLVAVEAFRRSDIASKLYFVARRRRNWEKLRERMEAAGMELPTPPQRQLDPELLRQMDAQEARITTTVDTTAVATRKRAALAAHASQLDQSWWVRFPEEDFAEVFGTETFIRAEDRTGAPLPENDLFAGIQY